MKEIKALQQVKRDIADFADTYPELGDQFCGTLRTIEEALGAQKFYDDHAIRPEDKLATLCNVKGNITIENGVAILPDGTQITL